MYNITIKIDEVTIPFKVKDLEEVLEILDQFVKIDEFHLRNEDEKPKVHTKGGR